MTNAMTYIVLDAFFATNDPQPALSVKVHAKTPEALYRALGRFFFTPGHSTPSLFNDDSLFALLSRQGIKRKDLADYSIAGCQEPLIMGKSSINTTNTWLNLAKILELALNDGKSTITGKKLGPSWQELGISGEEAAYSRLKETFLKMLDWFLPRMAKAGNACTDLLGTEKPVPMTSAVMDSFHTWRDMRDPVNPGVSYGGSGCLIHGLTVVANGIFAVEKALATRRYMAAHIRRAMTQNYAGQDELKSFLSRQDKFGNNEGEVDGLAAELADKVSVRVGVLRNSTGHPFLADWSTPSTHLLYGYWVGATPDGRSAREGLGYGIDPRVGALKAALPDRIVSTWKLPFIKMTGGYASHIGLAPGGVPAARNLEERGIWLRDLVIAPLFKLGRQAEGSPFYVYFNIDDAAHLEAVLKAPKRYAPDGIYIVRIHGTFVNILDLSPSIQRDIIERLELNGKKICA